MSACPSGSAVKMTHSPSAEKAGEYSSPRSGTSARASAPSASAMNTVITGV